MTGLVKSETDSKIVSVPSADDNPALVYLAGLKQSSRRVQTSALDAIARIVYSDDTATHADLDWPRLLQVKHMNLLRSMLIDTDLAPSTVNRYQAALRGVTHAAWQVGIIDGEREARLKDILKTVKGKCQPAGRYVPEAEIAAMYATCDDSDIGHRDAAIIALAHAAGLRRAEIVGLDLENVTGQADGSYYLKITGKGDKQRDVFIDNGAADALTDWLAIRGHEPGPVFLVVAAARGVGTGLSDQTIYDMLDRRADAANIAPVRPHDLRRTFISDQLDNGTDTVIVAKLAGHSSPATTARYDRRGERAKRKAASVTHTPYKRHGR
ncbi:MAG: site-specific integrase [Chloroflexota bacterium]|jgi:integrase